MPAFESRRVRTQPLTVTGTSCGAWPARISRPLNSLLSMIESYSDGASLSSGRLASIKPGQQPRAAAAIGVVFEAEPRAQQPLFSADASDQRREDEGCEQHADRRSEGEGPTQRVDEQPQIAGMA